MELITKTITGQVKTINEDVIKTKNLKGKFIACLCDGHWGKTAAALSSNHLVKHFPNTKNEAISTFREIELRLFEKIGKLIPDPMLDRPSETSLLAIRLDIKAGILEVVSYGDCRLLISQNGKIIEQIKTVNTWLGAFSHLKLRNRLSIEEALVYKTFKIGKNDTIWMFTDGVDQCVYETPTLPLEWIVQQDVETIFRHIEEAGAQDNASLMVMLN